MKFCKVADITDWQSEEFQRVASLLQLEPKTRKTWEYIQVYLGLEKLGLLNNQTQAIGLGVGHEPLIYAFTNVCESVVATDLYESQGWATASMKTAEVYQQNPFPFMPDRLTVKHMSMTDLDYPDESFDFVWSCCSIEHVNNFQDLHRVYQEIHRVLKPGGIAALTTEFNPTDLHSYEPNMLFTDRDWIDRWLTGENPLVRGFAWLDEIDSAVTDHPDNQPVPRSKRVTSIQTAMRDIVLNSIAFFLRKTDAFSQSYHTDWLPNFYTLYFEGCDAHRAKEYERSTALFQQLLADPSLTPRQKIAVLRRLAVTLDAQGKTAELLAVCKQVFPDYQQAEDCDHLLPLAQFCKKVGLWEEANGIYQRVASLPGTNVTQISQCLIGQAQYFAQQQDFHQALSLMNRATERLSEPGNKAHSKVYFHQGFYLEQVGQFEEAIAAYERAIEHSKANPSFVENCQSRIKHCQEQHTRVAIDASQTGLQKLKAKLSSLKNWMPLLR